MMLMRASIMCRYAKNVLTVWHSSKLVDVSSWALLSQRYFTFFREKYGIVDFRKASRIRMHHFYDHSESLTD